MTRSKKQILVLFIITLILLPSISLVTSGAKKKTKIIGFTDEYEPDNTFKEAKWIYPNGTSQERIIVEKGDVDWIKFNLTKGVLYIIETKPIGVFADTIMTLYVMMRGKLRKIAQDDDSGEKSCSRIVFMPKNDGTYYVKIWHKDKRKFGPSTKYSFSITPVLISIRKFNDGHDLPDHLASFDIKFLSIIFNSSLIFEIKFFSIVPNYLLYSAIYIDADNNKKTGFNNLPFKGADYLIGLDITGNKIIALISEWDGAKGEFRNITPKEGFSISLTPLRDGLFLVVDQSIFKNPPLGRMFRVGMQNYYGYDDLINALIEYNPGIRSKSFKRIIIDGLPDDWGDLKPAYLDKEEPIQGLPGFSDLKAIYIAHNATHLFIRIDTQGEEQLKLFNGSYISRFIQLLVDTDLNEETGYKLGGVGGDHRISLRFINVGNRSHTDNVAFVIVQSWDSRRKAWFRTKVYTKRYTPKGTLEWAIPLIDIPSFGRKIRIYFSYMRTVMFDFLPDNAWDGGWLSYDVITTPTMGIYGFSYVKMGNNITLLPGIEIKALASNGTLIARTLTDNDGFYYLEISSVKENELINLVAKFSQKEVSSNIKFEPYTLRMENIVIKPKS